MLKLFCLSLSLLYSSPPFATPGPPSHRPRLTSRQEYTVCTQAYHIPYYLIYIYISIRHASGISSAGRLLVLHSCCRFAFLCDHVGRSLKAYILRPHLINLLVSFCLCVPISINRTAWRTSRRLVGVPRAYKILAAAADDVRYMASSSGDFTR